MPKIATIIIIILVGILLSACHLYGAPQKPVSEGVWRRAHALLGGGRRVGQSRTQQTEEPEAKQKEEEEPGEKQHKEELRLVTVDAAMGITSDGGFDDVYLFIGPQVQVIRDGKFLKAKPRRELHLDDSMTLQAAFVKLDRPNPGRIYFGDEYGKLVSTTETGSGGGGTILQKRLRYGPARAFIRDGGPDAAARRAAGKVYVFKGCKMAVRNAWNDWEAAVDVASVGLPCHIDAAWSEKGNNMVVLKGDQIWRWNASDTEVRGPYDFGSCYKLKEGYALKPARD